MKYESIASQPVISAGRFVLRPLVAKDAALIARHAGQLRLARGTRSIPHPLPPGAAEAFVKRAMSPQRDEDVWAIDGTRHGSAPVLGVIGLAALDRGQSRIGYWVAPEYWNTGIASEALRAIVVANPHAARTLFAEVFQDNPASARVLTHAGFTYLGDAEAMCLARGCHVPTWTYTRRMA